MARRWTPQRFVTLRRIRVAVCVAAVLLTCVVAFLLTARKTVALTVNGETRTVTTYAQSVDRLLEEQHVPRKTHDIVKSSTGETLKNHAAVSMQSAYQATITIEGQQVPFWTNATSASQLLGFFKTNDANAAKVTVDINNIYNQLTGGFVINKAGPVTVIHDGQTQVVPNGKLSAASILDSLSITLKPSDRVSVEEQNGTTILRIQRVTHGNRTQDISVPFSVRTVTDTSLAPGQTTIRQQGVNGVKEQTYDVTYVDGQAESETLTSETQTLTAMDEVVAVGPAAPEPAPSTSPNANADSNGKDKDDTKDNKSDSADKDKTDKDNKDDDKNSDNSKPDNDSKAPASKPQPSKPATPAPAPAPVPQPAPAPAPAPQPAPAPAPTPTPAAPSNSNGMWHASPAAAQAYARGAAAQYGWTGYEYDQLVEIWNRESGWRWWAQNPTSTAYGIPQLLYPSWPNYHDDAGVQIGEGLNYISGRYGSPSGAVQHSNQTGWY